MKASILEDFAGQGVRLAVLPVLLLGMASISQAQATDAPAPLTIKAAALAAPATPVAHSEAQPKGNHEGIKVHGHWIIEVKNPDGRVVTHREFENSLYPSGGGASLLAAFLGRTATPGPWWIWLAAGSGTGPQIIIAEPNSTASSICPVAINPNLYPGAFCSSQLSISAPAMAAGSVTGTTLTLTGSATVPRSNPNITIGYVGTENLTCASSVSPLTCFDEGSTSSAEFGNFFLTQRSLDSQGDDPAPVNVNAGQMVAVTVVISFGSGN